jgi:hypothetical protein
MLRLEASGSNDKITSFSAISKVRRGMLLSANEIPDAWSATRMQHALSPLTYRDAQTSILSYIDFRIGAR